MDPYEILEISRFSSKEDIKKAFRKKAHENHPDKGGNNEKMREINNAYCIIKDIDPSLNNTTWNKNESVPEYNCEKCGSKSHYKICIDCWIKIKREEKRQRIHNIKSFMYCLNCHKSLYNRRLNTLFCDKNCLSKFNKNNIFTSKKCPEKKCLSDGEAFRIESLELEKVITLKRRERIAIFTRLIGKIKAVWLDLRLQEEYLKMV